MRLQIYALAFLALGCSIAEGQNPSPDNQAMPSTPQPLLRIERVREGEAVCALVQDDGTYRLEKLVRAKGDMYTGTTDADQIARLRAILADGQLKTISQDKIKADLFTDTLDHLDLAIWRERGWQLLSFRNPSSRKAFRDSLDPLLSWFQELQKKRPAATEVPGPATRCLPPNQLQARTEIQPASKPVSDADSAGSTPPFLFRFQSSQFLGGAGRSLPAAKVVASCTILYLDGTYHRERRTQTSDGARSEHAYRGQVNADSIAVVREVLDSPELKNAVPDAGQPKAAEEGQWTGVWIVREKGLQYLSFMSEFNTIGNPGKIGGMNNMTYHTGNEKVLDPLKHWMKDHTDKQEGATTEDKTINDCVPSR